MQYVLICKMGMMLAACYSILLRNRTPPRISMCNALISRYMLQTRVYILSNCNTCLERREFVSCILPNVFPLLSSLAYCSTRVSFSASPFRVEENAIQRFFPFHKLVSHTFANVFQQIACSLPHASYVASPYQFFLFGCAHPRV